MKTTKILLLIGCCCLMAVACGPKIPAAYTDSDALPRIYPDYREVTIPVNIAPLTFELDEEADEMVARYKVGDQEIVCADKMQPDMDDWRSMIDKAKGGAISVDVYVRRGEQWTHCKPFNIYVSPDSIDSYLSYRLIPPSFVSYEALTISQRCLENYDESVIYDNMLCGFEKEGQCINCHHYQQYNPERMQFHARQKSGGTVIAYDGKLKKVNMKNDSILSAGVYPAWHPWLNLIVYSTDKTHQNFHTTHSDKIEVYDAASDIIAYDVEKGEVTNFHIWHHDADLWMMDLQTGACGPMKEVNSSDTESYHTWSSNGRWLVVSSRRDDGTFTRPFFAHIDKDGKCSKPFELPQADPDYHRQFLRCYNIPEFMKGPVTISPQTFADLLKGEGEPVKYVGKLSK